MLLLATIIVAAPAADVDGNPAPLLIGALTCGVLGAAGIGYGAD